MSDEHTRQPNATILALTKHRLDETDRAIAGVNSTMSEIKELLTTLNTSIIALQHEMGSTKERHATSIQELGKLQGRSEVHESRIVHLETLCSTQERQLVEQWKKFEAIDKWQKEVDADRNRITGFWLAAVAVGGLVSWFLEMAFGKK